RSAGGRSRSIRRWGVWFLLALLAAGPVLAADSAAKKESELKELKERIEGVRKSIQADAQRRDALTGELQRADEQIQTVRVQLADIRTQRLAAEQQLQELNTEHGRTERQIAAERESLAGELRLAYMNGRGEQLKLLLNQQDPVRMGRLMAYYGYFG